MGSAVDFGFILHSFSKYPAQMVVVIMVAFESAIKWARLIESLGNNHIHRKSYAESKAVKLQTCDRPTHF